jgi:hypothetical protein
MSLGSLSISESKKPEYDQNSEEHRALEEARLERELLEKKKRQLELENKEKERIREEHEKIQTERELRNSELNRQSAGNQSKKSDSDRWQRVKVVQSVGPVTNLWVESTTDRVRNTVASGQRVSSNISSSISSIHLSQTDVGRGGIRAVPSHGQKEQLNERHDSHVHSTDNSNRSTEKSKMNESALESCTEKNRKDDIDTTNKDRYGANIDNGWMGKSLVDQNKCLVDNQSQIRILQPRKLYDPKSNLYVEQIPGKIPESTAHMQNKSKSLLFNNDIKSVIPKEKGVELQLEKDELQKTVLARSDARRKEREARPPRTQGFLFCFNSYGKIEPILSNSEKALILDQDAESHHELLSDNSSLLTIIGKSQSKLPWQKHKDAINLVSTQASVEAEHVDDMSIDPSLTTNKPNEFKTKIDRRVVEKKKFKNDCKFEGLSAPKFDMTAAKIHLIDKNLKLSAASDDEVTGFSQNSTSNESKLLLNNDEIIDTAGNYLTTMNKFAADSNSVSHSSDADHIDRLLGSLNWLSDQPSSNSFIDNDTNWTGESNFCNTNYFSVEDNSMDMVVRTSSINLAAENAPTNYEANIPASNKTSLSDNLSSHKGKKTSKNHRNKHNSTEEIFLGDKDFNSSSSKKVKNRGIHKSSSANTDFPHEKYDHSRNVKRGYSKDGGTRGPPKNPYEGKVSNS